MADEMPDEVAPEVNESEVQSTPEGGDQGTQSTDQSQAAVEQYFAELGGEKFKTADDLKNGYVNLRKGFTQATQKYSNEVKNYKVLNEWIQSLRKDPAKWQRFLRAIDGQEEAPKPQAQPKGQEQPQQFHDPRYEQLAQKLEWQEARAEYNDFVSGHPELNAQEISEITDRVIELEDAGKVRSFEEVYRTEFFEKAAAKFYSKGQKAAVDESAKNKGAKSIGSAPPSNAAPKKVKYSDLKTENERNKYIADELIKRGAKFDE